MNIQAFNPVDKAAFHRFIATEPEGRYEFARGRIVEMHGGTNRHFRIAQRFLMSLLSQLDDARWLAYSEFGVETSETVRFPDIVVLPAGEPDEARWTKAPGIVVEVLSPSTTRLDLDEKPAEYMSLPTLSAYIVASQTEVACLVWLREADGRFPSKPSEFIAGQTISIPSVGVAIEVSAIYSGIDLKSKGPSPHG